MTRVEGLTIDRCLNESPSRSRLLRFILITYGMQNTKRGYDIYSIHCSSDPSLGFFLFFSSSGGWGKIKLQLTTIPRIFIHVVCRFNSIVIRNPAIAGVSFSSRGSDRASCPCLWSMFTRRQKKEQWSNGGVYLLFWSIGDIGQTRPREALARAPECPKSSSDALERCPQALPSTRTFSFLF